MFTCRDCRYEVQLISAQAPALSEHPSVGYASPAVAAWLLSHRVDGLIPEFSFITINSYWASHRALNVVMESSDARFQSRYSEAPKRPWNYRQYTDD